MKKLSVALLCMLFLGLCACGPVEPHEATTTAMTTPEKTTKITHTEQDASISAPIPTGNDKTTENNLYSEAIKAINKNFEDAPNQLKDMRYALYDLDGNGALEFLQGLEGGGVLYLTAIYTIQNDVAVRQEEFWYPDFSRSSPALLFKNGTVRTSSDNDGDLYTNYFRFENGVLRHKATLTDIYGQYFRYNENVTYPGTPITKAEFDRVQKEFEGDGQVVELDWKPLAEYGR